VGCVALCPSWRELKSMSYSIPPLLYGTFVFGVNTVVNPL
jgi:hypothetical protein